VTVFVESLPSICQSALLFLSVHHQSAFDLDCRQVFGYTARAAIALLDRFGDILF
jgi:hypothetical protein